MQSIGKSCDALFTLRTPVAAILILYIMRVISSEFFQGQYSFTSTRLYTQPSYRRPESQPFDCLYYYLSIAKCSETAAQHTIRQYFSCVHFWRRLLWMNRRWYLSEFSQDVQWIQSLHLKPLAPIHWYITCQKWNATYSPLRDIAWRKSEKAV